MHQRENSTGRVALVLGSSGGIGSAVMETLWHNGIHVAGIDIERPRQAPADPGFMFVQADAASEEELQQAVAQVAGEYRRIDYAINMIGIVGHGPLADTSLADWQLVLDVNLNSCFLLAKYGYPHLRASQGGLVFCSSTNGLNGGNALSGAAYAAAKAAILNLNRYLAREWASDGIRVNCIAPGPVDTPMLRRLPERELAAIRATIPTGRFSTAAEVAEAVVFLCSDAAATRTGTVTNISGGLYMD